MIKLRSFLFTVVAMICMIFQTFATVRFVHFSDPHIFESIKYQKEAATSAKDFDELVKKIHAHSKGPLDFAIVTGDLGVGKFLEVNPKTGLYEQKRSEWDAGLKTLAAILKDSGIKRWFFVPGNNDLFEEIPQTITYYQDFLKQLGSVSELQKEGISVIDFRLEAPQKAQSNMPAGMYMLKDMLFVGWDNSYFKNNNEVKHYIGKDGKIIPFDQTLEYKSVQKLSGALKPSKAKFAYIFYHIPSIDDPFLIQTDNKKAKEIVERRMTEAETLSPTFARGLYPYSAWTVPLEVRQAWEETVSNQSKQGPIIKGLFAGHFHDHKKEIYRTTSWVKSDQYKPELLKKLYLSPPVSLKLQASYPPSERARGSQIVSIDEKNGDVSREMIWLD